MDKIQIRCTGADTLPIDRIVEFQGSLKKLSKENATKLRNSILKFGFIAPFFVWDDGGEWRLLDGHQRLAVLLKMREEGYDIPLLPVDYIEADSVEDAKRKLLHITSQYGEFTLEGFEEFSAGLDDFPDIRLTDGEFTFSGDTTDEERYNLKDLFEANPFSVIDARTGEWQDSKKEWLNVIPDSTKGRDDNLTNAPKREYGEGTCDNFAPGTSVFDPKLASVMYKWFCKDGGEILDPFCGGSVRGIVAGLKGYNYTGIDIRKEQIDTNRDQSNNIQYGEIGNKPTYILGDSNKVIPELNKKYDMIFSCPPYGDLEKYSDMEDDISNMSYENFMVAYRNIIKLAVGKLKDEGTAVFVVGDIRDKKGIYRSFVPDTISSFISAGMQYYNEIIFISPNGTAGMRAKRQFSNGMKVVKTHQNIVMFIKTRVKKANDR